MFILFYSELVPLTRDVLSSHTLLGWKKYEDEMSDEQPTNLRESSRYYKAGDELLQIEVGDLLQSETIIIRKNDRFYKFGQFNHKVEQVLQIEEINTK